MKIALLAPLVVCTIVLTACAGSPSTPYRPIVEGKISTGYASEKLEDDLYRIDFMGSPSTSQRTAAAFTLYRAAELAHELGMAAFTVVEGPIDRSVLNSSEVFSWRNTFEGAFSVDGIPRMQRVAGAIIWIPIYRPEDRPQGKLVILKVRMHKVIPIDQDHRTFLTSAVLSTLGPRIVRAPRV